MSQCKKMPGDCTNAASAAALLLIDVINDCDFPESEELLKFAIPMAEKIATLASRARSAKVPVIYINDNFGRWRSDFKSIVRHCASEHSVGRPIVELLIPHEQDYFVLKPKHSGFFSTTLDVLLAQLGVKTVIITGMAANICVLFTANDAYMRDLNVIVPSDCVASNTKELNDYALDQMRTVVKANTEPSMKLCEKRLRELCGGDDEPTGSVI
jgi:nicotinamidase-related amidase